MRNETIEIVKRLKIHFINDFIYDMGGGYNPVDSSLVGKKVKVVDYLPDPRVDIVNDLVNLVDINDDSVDNIFCSDVLEHVTRPWDVIREFYRVLKPEGVIFLTAPFVWHFHGHEYESNNWETRVDFWRFTPSALESLCYKYFEKIECDWDLKPPLGPQTSPLWRCGSYYIGKKNVFQKKEEYSLNITKNLW